jgi:hypothetical protein
MKILRRIILLILVLSLAGCHMKTDPEESTGGLTMAPADEPEICRTPPVLTLMHDRGSTEALLGTYSWNYHKGDGSWAGIEADAMHPLDCQDSLLPIGTEKLYAELSFAVEPDSVSIRCWHDSQWGNYDAQAEAVAHYGNVFELMPGGYIYEVTATWADDGGTFHGTAHYAFYVTAGVYGVMPIDK